MKKLFKIATTFLMAAFLAVMAISCDIGVGPIINPGAGIQESEELYPEIKYLTVRYQETAAANTLTTVSTYTADIPAGATFNEIEAKAKQLCSTVAAGFEARDINYVGGSTYEINFYRKAVTLTFKMSSALNADVFATRTGVYGASYSTPSSSGLVVPEGKKFNYWYASGFGSVSAGISQTFPSADRTYYASFSALTYYTVTFETEIGTAPDPIRILSGTKLTEAQLPTPENNIDDRPFLGWYNGNTKVTTATSISSNITLKAKWGEYFTIEYFDPMNYSEVPVTQRVSSGTKLTGLLNPLTDSAYGFTSTQWNYANGNKAKETDTVTKNIKLYAQWKNRYTLSYVSKYGETPATKVVEQGYKITAADLPLLTNNNTGFNSSGWYIDKDYKSTISVNTTVSKDYTFYAKWLDTYILRYKTAYGKAPAEIIFQEGSAITAANLPVVTDPETGFVSTGWIDENGEAILDTTVIKRNLEITAVWKKRFTINYSTSTTQFANVIVPSKIVEDGYVLTYADLPAVGQSDKDSNKYVSVWFYDNGSTPERIYESSSFTVTSDVTLQCSWYRLYNISYETPYGSAPASIILPQGDFLNDANLVPVTEASTGFTSLYWYNKDDETKTPVTTSTVISADTVLAAAWKNRYSVVYATDKGHAPDTLVVEDGTALTKAQLPAVQLDSNPPYFTGWYDGDNKISVGYVVTHNILISAKWSMTAVPVKYVTEFGVTPEETTVVPGTILTDEELPVLTYDNRFFVGWYDEDGNLAVPGSYELLLPVEFTARWADAGIKATISANSSQTVSLGLHYAIPYTVTLLNDGCEITATNNGSYTTTIESGKQFETMLSTNKSGIWGKSITIANNTAEEQSITIVADYKPCNEVPYKITATTTSTAVEDFVAAYTSSENYYTRAYMYNTNPGTEYRVQWKDSLSNVSISNLPAGITLGDMYIYVYDANTGNILTSTDDGQYVTFTATDRTYIVVRGRTKTCTSYFRPYILN